MLHTRRHMRRELDRLTGEIHRRWDTDGEACLALYKRREALQARYNRAAARTPSSCQVGDTMSVIERWWLMVRHDNGAASRVTNSADTIKADPYHRVVEVVPADQLRGA